MKIITKPIISYTYTHYCFQSSLLYYKNNQVVSIEGLVLNKFLGSLKTDLEAGYFTYLRSYA